MRSQAQGMAPAHREVLRRRLASAAAGMCSHVLLGASSLDGKMEGRCEGSMEYAGVESNVVDESQRSSRSIEVGRWQNDQYERYVPRGHQQDIDETCQRQSLAKKHEFKN